MEDGSERKQDGEHITLQCNKVNVHAYIIYPEKEGGIPLPLGGDDVDKVQRQRSNFAIADVRMRKNPWKILTDPSALGYKILKFFEVKDFSLAEPDHILVYNSVGMVTVRRVDNPTKTLYTFDVPVVLPAQMLKEAVAPSERPCSTGGSGQASSSQSAKPKPKPDSGKNETNPSNDPSFQFCCARKRSPANTKRNRKGRRFAMASDQ